ncbi:inositol monophosphatase family protein [Balneolaceae bacterium ANBcel3]|nr:inositol monophosphatase family protein [Balneolaceae bacterium ANBcel3]
MESKTLQTARLAAQKAKEVITYYDQNRTLLDVGLKRKNDLITRADGEAEEQIIKVITSAFPEDSILAEESTGEIALTDNRTWIIDPIDGTTNFAHGLPVYCVSIAMWENKKPKVGLVLEVNRDEWYTAEAEKGAFLNGKPIRVSGCEHHQESLLATGFPYRDMEMVDAYLDLFKVFMHETQGVRRPGSAAFDLCLVAAGRCDGFFEYGLSAWDVAAGSLIIRESGGVVGDWLDGENWLFGRRIIAGNPAIYKYLLERIQQVIPEKFLEEK